MMTYGCAVNSKTAALLGIASLISVSAGVGVCLFGNEIRADLALFGQIAFGAGIACAVISLVLARGRLVTGWAGLIIGFIMLAMSTSANF
jgi:hypothetical protein